MCVGGGGGVETPLVLIIHVKRLRRARGVATGGGGGGGGGRECSLSAMWVGCPVDRPQNYCREYRCHSRLAPVHELMAPFGSLTANRTLCVRCVVWCVCARARVCANVCVCVVSV